MENFIIPKRKLGGTELDLSFYSLGTVKFGRNTLIKNKRGEGAPLPSDETIDQLLREAQEAGVNLIDTAPAYGTAEERVGLALKRLGLNDKFIISSKVGECFDGVSSNYDFSQAAIIKSIEGSLKRLKIEKIDLMMLHCHKDDLRILKESPALEVLLLLKDRGLIRYIGASTITDAGTKMAIDELDFAMVVFNYLDQSKRPLINYALQKSKGILIKKGLLSGYLSDENPEEDLRKCVTCLWSEPGISSVVCGSTNPLHLRQNLKIFHDTCRNVSCS